MTVQKLADLLGRQATWNIFDLQVPVEITDARHMFGRVDVKIRPIGGGGEHWCTDKAIHVVEG